MTNKKHQKAIENDHRIIEIVEFPIQHGNFPLRYVALYQAGYIASIASLVPERPGSVLPTLHPRSDNGTSGIQSLH